AVLLGSDLTNEEGKMLLDFTSNNVPGAVIFHFGTPGVKNVADDQDADKILKRKSKTANLHGMERLGIKPFEKMPAGIEAAIVIRGGRAVLPEIKGVSVVGIGVFRKSEADTFAAVLPGAGFAEKDGTVTSSNGMDQSYSRAIAPPGQSKGLSEILMTWANSKEAGHA
ncbi:MAG: hypothetical protein AABZ55_11370, partial [Bdellovibrionota bacterium]